jgi:hypothetical protein
MDNLAIHLALHGVLVITVSVLGGVVLYRSILKKTNVADWHLLHAGGSARGILLIALAAVIHFPALPPWQLTVLAWFVIYFVWTSTLAMLIRAITSEPGFEFSGSRTNKLVFVLYASGAATLFPGLVLLVVGLLNAL